jgi:hypothetical protein
VCLFLCVLCFELLLFYYIFINSFLPRAFCLLPAACWGNETALSRRFPHFKERKCYDARLFPCYCCVSTVVIALQHSTTQQVPFSVCVCVCVLFLLGLVVFLRSAIPFLLLTYCTLSLVPPSSWWTERGVFILSCFDGILIVNFFWDLADQYKRINLIYRSW